MEIENSLSSVVLMVSKQEKILFLKIFISNMAAMKKSFYIVSAAR